MPIVSVCYPLDWLLQRVMEAEGVSLRCFLKQNDVSWKSPRRFRH